MPGQIGFGPLPGELIHPAGQLAAKPADDGDLTGSELSRALSGSGGGQHRCDGLAGQPVARSQVGGFLDAARGFSATDQGPIGQGVRQRAAKLLWAGLSGNVIDELMFGHWQAASRFLTALQQRQAFSGRQRAETQTTHTIERGIERVEDLDDLFPTTRTHTPQRKKHHRQSTPHCDH